MKVFGKKIERKQRCVYEERRKMIVGRLEKRRRGGCAIHNANGWVL